MKKISLLVLPIFIFAILLPIAAPVYAAPPADIATVDTPWKCYAGWNNGPCNATNSSGTSTSSADYSSPYTFDFQCVTNCHLVLYPYVGDATTYPITSATLECTPQPGCLDDFDVFVRVEGSIPWWIRDEIFSHQAPHHMVVDISLQVRGDGGVQTINLQQFDCGIGLAGTCEFVYYVTVPSTYFQSTNNVNPDITVLSKIYSIGGTGGSEVSTPHYTVYMSRLAYRQTCSENFILATNDGPYYIDPTIADPQGAPDDQQKQTVVQGQIYRISTAGGPWHDGINNNDRYDTAISWDGVTYTPLSQLADALCIETTEANIPDLLTVYVEAQSNSFYIRVNDVPNAGWFDNNTEVNPLTYTIGLAFQNAAPPCESQFTWDPFDDLVSFVGVDSQLQDGVRATTDTPLIVGEWYAVEVSYGAWTENGGPDRTDLEFDVTDSTTGASYWRDLAEGSNLVWCQTEDGLITFFQADHTNLFLRANDQDANFANNAGTVWVDIYHVMFNRASELCESQFALGDIYGADYVDAKAENGKTFAFSVGSQNVSLSTGLVPGAWYAVETTDGPWGYEGSLHGDLAMSYEMAINDGSGTGWVPLDEWLGGACNVQIDALGHRLVYFQIPEGSVDYKLRVNDTESWLNNINFMGWNLYKAVNLNQIPTGECDYVYDPDIVVLTSYVSATSSAGGYVSPLNANSFYAVKILGNSYDWFEQSGGEARDDMQISDDDGQTWHELPDGYAGNLCYIYNGDDLIFFIKTGNNNLYKLRVNSSSFSDNVGSMGWEVYAASPGDTVDPWTNCMDQWQLTVIEPHGTIPVRDEQGTIIKSEYNYPENNGLLPDLSGGDPNYNGTSNGNYVIEIEYGSGPWRDGETSTDHYDAQLSADGGVTWYDMSDRDAPILDCAVQDQIKRYWKARIHVEQGQVWKIRVGDTETSVFSDNSGNLAYVLYSAFDHPGVPMPIDPNSIPAISVNGGDVCLMAIVSPGPLSISEIADLGNYFAEWISFLNLAIARYMAFCPRHTSMILSMLDALKTREPFATLDEIDNAIRDVQIAINGYDWGSTGTDYSILTKNGSGFISQLNKYLLPPLASNSPWMGGPVIQYSGPQSYPQTCQMAAADYVGPLLSKGVCFVVNVANQTGFMWFIQMFLDITALFLAFSIIWNGAVDAISMFTGVPLKRIWAQNTNVPQIERLLEDIGRRR